MTPCFTLRFWGVRGSIPTPQRDRLGYGGNTACVELRGSGEERLILDAGTGIRGLGDELPLNAKVTILFTHFHWDHLQGLPFFAPVFSPESEITLASTRPPAHLRAVFDGLLQPPYHPISFDHFRAGKELRQLDPHEMRAGFEIRPFALYHPQGCSGFRIERGGSVVVHATDHEHGDATSDRRLYEAAKGADLLIYDAQYTPENYPDNQGRGHSTWLEAVKLAAKAGVKKLALFHHDPNHSDDDLESTLEKTRKEYPDTILAREGEVITF